jgi:8-oxo-dGTP pyrophosphatase MutT (NUDIX family)
VFGGRTCGVVLVLGEISMREDLSAYHFVVNVEAIVRKQDRFLMITRSESDPYGAGWLTFPGGKVDRGPDQPDILEDSVRREVLEETGIHVGKIEYLKSKFFSTDEGIGVVDVVFVCDYESGEPMINDPKEVGSVQWMTREEILEHPKTQIWTKEDLLLVL